MEKRQSLNKLAYRFIILFGVISALGDITYEGARSVTGPYLHTLGASAVAIGLVTGVGEFLGYVLRIASGYWVDRTKSYWTITYVGYALLLSVPLLAFTGHWQLAALFFILERVGKAIRSPGKDTMLSFATKRVGTGYGFGLHEAIDQAGAFIGPLLLTLSFSLTNSYRTGFMWTLIPVFLLLVVLSYLRIKVPNPETMETSLPKGTEQVQANITLPSVFWRYIGFSFISMVGFVSFPLLSLHMSQRHIISPAWIPILYALAMGMDAMVALWVGKRYDRNGFKELLWIPVLSIPVVLLGFVNHSWMIVIAVICWGALMGIQETMMKAAIADLIPIHMRGRAYAIFNITLGLAMLIGSSMMGWMYETSISILIAFVMVTQIIALFLHRKVNKII
ncbi:MFS family permease [Anoxybacillus tepidamans]|uniref:MFS family permease n=1 Tax=Anoxybacteroides tepidamans TaxID=265948 RepID=A0A7W8MTX9_9BACL|nr:MFS transporter [Anoxybacillus tepidamans]MBB5323278.1 MFS family permease [Anoxybacillus tepidamans]